MSQSKSLTVVKLLFVNRVRLLVPLQVFFLLLIFSIQCCLRPRRVHGIYFLNIVKSVSDLPRLAFLELNLLIELDALLICHVFTDILQILRFKVSFVAVRLHL